MNRTHGCDRVGQGVLGELLLDARLFRGIRMIDAAWRHDDRVVEGVDSITGVSRRQDESIVGISAQLRSGNAPWDVRSVVPFAGAVMKGILEARKRRDRLSRPRQRVASITKWTSRRRGTDLEALEAVDPPRGSRQADSGSARPPAPGNRVGPAPASVVRSRPTGCDGLLSTAIGASSHSTGRPWAITNGATAS